MRHIIVLLLACLPAISFGQISGQVTSYDEGEVQPLPGANVYWKGTESGTVTDEDGNYSIETSPESNTLVVSFVGFETKSKVVISRKGTMNFTLVPTGYELEDAEIIGRVDATAVDLKRADLTYRIDDKELRKAACCNLSESFETNASVDVAFTDAVTGTRQIEMLGLAGKYALIQRENIPFARGLNANTGLTYIPGPFVESIQLTKGLSSVLNGYESITGQINVEFYKPETSPGLFLNAFANQGGRAELNAISAFEVSDNVSSAILAHASTIPFAQDKNNDGFADIPMGNQLNFSNRWHWRSEESGWEGQIGLTAIQDEKTGGQVDVLNEKTPPDSLWGFDSQGRRVELFGKNGYMFEGAPFRSIGIIYSLNYQDRDAGFGRRDYSGSQKSAYLNTIYQDIFGNTQHKYRTGISVLAEEVQEHLSDPQFGGGYTHLRQELVPGAYFEYTYEPDLNFTLVAGARADYNTYFDQLFFTPRLNLRYMPSEKTTLRLGGGRGQRTPNVVAENLNVLASSRRLSFDRVTELRPEVGWNMGASVDQDIPAGNKDIGITVDAFYTWFESKLVADLDYDRQMAHFLLPQGSNSLSVLGQVDYELFKNFEIRLAYKYLHSRDRFIEKTDLSYLVPRHRAFANFAYATEDQWKFDLTLNWFGQKRLPESSGAPADYARPAFSPDFFTVNAQINKVFGDDFEVYLGVDNLLDFRQENPVVRPDDPYAPYFDSNYTWGPIFGRNIYAGLYYTLGKK